MLLLLPSLLLLPVASQGLIDVKGHELAELAVDALLLDDLVYVMVALRLRVEVCAMALVFAVPGIVL